MKGKDLRYINAEILHGPIYLCSVRTYIGVICRCRTGASKILISAFHLMGFAIRTLSF